MSKFQERLIVVIIILVALLSSVAVLLLVTNYDTSFNVPGFSGSNEHYSQPITVLSQSATGLNGRNAYVKMTLVAASNERATNKKLSDQEDTVKSIISLVLNRHSPESLLKPSELLVIQQEIADSLSEELALPINQVYFDRITVQ